MKNKYLSKIKKLNKVQFEVTQNKGTEKAFANQYWNHKGYGIYVDIISDEPFSLHLINLILVVVGLVLPKA